MVIYKLQALWARWMMRGWCAGWIPSGVSSHVWSSTASLNPCARSSCTPAKHAWQIHPVETTPSAWISHVPKWPCAPRSSCLQVRSSMKSHIKVWKCGGRGAAISAAIAPPQKFKGALWVRWHDSAGWIWPMDWVLSTPGLKQCSCH